MKTLKESILSSTRTGKKAFYTLFPKDRFDLYDMIKNEIREKGNNCSLNHIDVSKITDMSCLFERSKFNGNISEWDTSNVTNMSYMFYKSDFNGDISNWNVSKVTKIFNMFCNSYFNQDISKWDVSKVTDM